MRVAADLGDGTHPRRCSVHSTIAASLRTVVRRIEHGTLAPLDRPTVPLRRRPRRPPRTHPSGTRSSSSRRGAFARPRSPSTCRSRSSSPTTAPRSTSSRSRARSCRSTPSSRGRWASTSLDGLEPGRYTLRCIVSGHREQAVLTVPSARVRRRCAHPSARGACTSRCRPARAGRRRVGPHGKRLRRDHRRLERRDRRAGGRGPVSARSGSHTASRRRRRGSRRRSSADAG